MELRKYGGSKTQPENVGAAVAKALTKDVAELRVGQTNFFHAMLRIAPDAVFTMTNKAADSLAAKAK